MLKETDFVSLRPVVWAQLLTEDSNNFKSEFDLLGVNIWDGKMGQHWLLRRAN